MYAALTALTQRNLQSGYLDRIVDEWAAFCGKIEQVKCDAMSLLLGFYSSLISVNTRTITHLDSGSATQVLPPRGRQCARLLLAQARQPATWDQERSHLQGSRHRCQGREGGKWRVLG